jgi:hypothetical protein
MAGKKHSASIIKYFLNALSIIPKNLVSTKLRLIEFLVQMYSPLTINYRVTDDLLFFTIF